MSDKLWTDVDDYLEQLLPQDASLSRALEESRRANLPSIQVSPLQGRFLQLLARGIGARRILEVGTLGGYSTIWLSRALGEGGRMVSLEVEPKHAEVARKNLRVAGVTDRVEVRLGPALTSLPRLAEEGWGPVDLSFIDADKENNAAYFDWAVRLSRPGALIVVDNVVREGQVLETKGNDPKVAGTRRLFEHVRGDPRVEATALQTVGSKKHDGFLLAWVRPSAADPKGAQKPSA